MNEYKLFHNMGYLSKGLRQICIVVNERFGYVGITDPQWEELKELEKKVYSKSIDDLIPPERYEGGYNPKLRAENLAILKANRVNDVWVQYDGNRVVGFALKPHTSCQRAKVKG